MILARKDKCTARKEKKIILYWSIFELYLIIYEELMIQKNNSAAKIRTIMTGLMLSLLLAALDNTIVATAMPKIINDLQGMKFYSLPFTSYLLFSTVVIPVAGKLSDVYGRKIVVLWGMILFLITSILCAFSMNMSMLIVFRGFQGACGGVLASSAFIITSELFPPEDRGKYIGILASMHGLASLLGPITGGLITDYLSWRWIFFINIPIGLISFQMMKKNLPEMKHSANERKLDLKGISLFLLTMFPLLFCFTEFGKLLTWKSPLLYILFSTSFFMFFWFVLTEKKSHSPLIPSRLISNNIFRKSAFAAFMLYFALFGIILYVPFLMQVLLKKSAAFSGIMMLPMTLSMVIGGMVGGFLTSKLQKFKILGILGFFLAITGMVAIYMFGTQISSMFLIFSLLLIGLGLGSVFPIINIAPQSVFPASELGMVISNLEFFQIMGGVISTSILGNILQISVMSVIGISILALFMGVISIALLNEKTIKEGFAKNSSGL